MRIEYRAADRLGKLLIRKPLARRSRNRSPNGPGRPLKRALSKIRQPPPPETPFDWQITTGDRVVSWRRVRDRNSTRSPISTKSSFLESSLQGLQVALNRRIQGRLTFTACDGRSSRFRARGERDMMSRLLKSSRRDEQEERHDNDTLGARPGGSRPENNTPRVLLRRVSEDTSP